MTTQTETSAPPKDSMWNRAKRRLAAKRVKRGEAVAVDLDEAKKPGNKIVAGFHCVKLADGRYDIAIFDGSSAESLLACIGVATMKIQDHVREFERVQMEQAAKAADAAKAANPTEATAHEHEEKQPLDAADAAARSEHPTPVRD